MGQFMKNEKKTIYQGKTLPKKNVLNAIGDKIFSAEENTCVKYILKASHKESQRNIFYLGRHKDVMAILKGEHADKVDISQFDECLSTGVGEERFFLGAESVQKSKQWEILKAAFSQSPKLSRADEAKNFQRNVDEAVSTTLKDLRQRHERLGCWDRIKTTFGKPPKVVKINAIKEYGYVVPFLALTQFVGLQMPTRASWQLRAFTALRNFIRPGTLRLNSEPLRSASQMLMWSLFIVAHLFSNVGNRNKLFRVLSLWASRQFRRQIDESFNAKILPYGSLLYRLKLVRNSEFSTMSDAEYLRHVRGIVIEIVGAGQILTGISFARILRVLHNKDKTVSEFYKLIVPEEASEDKKNYDIIDEALRLDTTTQSVYRVAKDYIVIGGQSIAPNDLICLLIDRACVDELVFPQAETFSDFTSNAPKRNRENYLTFGPHEAASPNVFQPINHSHPCFGQYWARSLLTAMFKGLHELPGISFKNSVKPIFKDFANIPDTGQLVYRRPKAEALQTIVTICSEIAIPLGNEGQPATVQKLLDGLGNPVAPDLSAELQKIETLHFVSMHVIEGVNTEPDYLLLEISVDGDESSAIDDILNNDFFRLKLEEIYKAAGCIRKDTELRRHLGDHSVELKQSLWPNFFSGRWVNGLGFSGTDGLTLKRIKAEQKIADFVSSQLSAKGKFKVDGAPHKILKTIRQKVLTYPKLEDARWALHDSKPPQFAETRDSAWKKTWGKVEEITRLFPHAFLFFLAIIGVVLWSAIWEVSFAGESSSKQAHLFPPDVTSLFYERIDKTKKVDVYLSAMPLIFNCSVALLLTFILTSLFKPQRKTVALKQSGSMFLFIGVFAFLQFQIVYHNFTQKLLVIFDEQTDLDWQNSKLSKLFGFDKQRLDWLPENALAGVAIVLLAGSLIISLLAVYKAYIGKRGINRGYAPYAILFGLMLLFGTVAIQQYVLFNNSDVKVVNRFYTAKLSVLLLYPLLLSSILIGSIYAFNNSFPDYKLSHFNSRKRYWVWGSIFFLVIFYTSFFAAPNSVNIHIFINQIILAVTMVVFFPLLLAVLLCFLTFSFWPTLSRKKQFATVKAHLIWWTFSVSVALNLTNEPRGFLSKFLAKQFDMEVGQPNALGLVRKKMAEIFIAFGIMLPVLLIFGVFIILLLSRLLALSESNNNPHDSDAQLSNIEKIMLKENQPDYVQNHMISVTRLIPEKFRRSVTLPMALSIMVTATKKQRARPGFLGTIGTVHFARWIHLPRTNNYIFMSNYDGSFESYLEDFITKFKEPLNGAWSHGVGYPRTKGVFYEGAEDGERFIRWARGSMRPTPFWYSAYPKLTVEQIRRNALIRDGLARIENPGDAEAWLDLFDSVTRPDHALQTDQIQSLVFGGAKKLKYGCCLVVQRDQENLEALDENTFSHWLNTVQKNITYGDITPGDSNSYLALSKEGLKHAGFSDFFSSDRRWTGSEEATDEQRPTKFSPAFSLGMNNPSRAPILGDLGVNAPINWEWGKKENPALAVLLIYGKTKKELTKLVKDRKAELTQNGMSTYMVDFDDPANPEPFGFKDGISNPILKGTTRGARNKDSIHLVNPGEVILGYKDNRGFFPSSPQIESVRDHHDILPAIPRSQPQKYPLFQDNTSDALRDLGRNGSYLVIRQLEQDVTAFKETTKGIAREMFKDEFESGSKKRKENAVLAVQAKLMGRWQDGRPLVTAPVKLIPLPDGKKRLVKTKPYPTNINWEEAERRDNEFLFGRDDPQGHACPFGSHIRRTFPRDSLNPGEEAELEISNRHRLLRRGRSFKASGGHKRKGTFFVCLNVNIERQFEFVQQTWVNGTTFHGLRNEVDPITAQHDLANQNFTFQVPGRDKKVKSLQSFVKMRGGGYFFMPGRDALEFIAKYKTEL